MSSVGNLISQGESLRAGLQPQGKLFDEEKFL
jgi:hypothetical protein